MVFNLRLFLTLLVLLFPNSLDAVNCNCVAFKLITLQDYYLTTTATAVIQTFLNANDALTIGVLGGSIYFGNDPTLLSLLETALNGHPNIEIANNGDLFETFSNMTLSDQINALNVSNSNIMTYIGQKPIVFIPPYGLWSQTTITALVNTSFRYISGLLSLDSPPFPGPGPVFKYPSGASTTTPTGTLYTANNTFSQIQVQHGAYGFAVVELDLSTYSQLDNNSNPLDIVNTEAIQSLQTLLSYIKIAGYSIVPVSKIGLDSGATIPPPTPTAKTQASVKTSATSSSTSAQPVTAGNAVVSKGSIFSPLAFLFFVCLLFIN